MSKGYRRFEVLPKRLKLESSPLDQDIFEFLGISLNEMKQANIYWLEDSELQEDKWDEIQRKVLSDEILEDVHSSKYNVDDYFTSTPSFVVEKCFLPGVTDNAARSASDAMKIVTGKKIDCASGTLFFLFGSLSDDDAKEVATKFLGNSLIEGIKVYSYNEFIESDRFQVSPRPEVKLSTFDDYQTYDLEVSDSELEKMSKENIWALTLDEMKVIQSHFRDEKVKKRRSEKGLPESPTDVEIEILAQTWSEHCKHKIFASKIDYKETETNGTKSLGDMTVDSLYKTYIKGATKQSTVPWLVSVFSDNAGVVRFSDKVDVAIKVETHNSPSALDPYGGALTGIVGVNRDILGVGLGARPIANTNVLCFAPPHWPKASEKSELPLGLLHPKRILKGVHKGIEDGGNKSGIPTVNGAIYFDYNYSGKPLVYCGTLGVIPPVNKDGVDLSKKYHEPGDAVVMVGGAIGADGIHGATFSSMELDETAPATAVQIGDPLTQRRVTDFMMEAQKQNLYCSVTDNGAGGLSSSIGEMAEKTNGAIIDVAKAHTKYPGVKPFELVISESQERMSFAVKQENLEKFLTLAKEYNVDACHLGEFNDSGYFTIEYQGRLVGSLSMEFMHDGLPQMQLKADFKGPHEFTFKEEKKQSVSNYEEVIYKLLSSPNIASKERWVRQYDHEVQASTVVKPFIGKKTYGPSDSGVVWLKPHGGNDKEAIAIGCGFNPRLSYHDTYLMTQYAVDESIRNILCQGADLSKIALVDNFCWPDPIKKDSNPDGEQKLAALVRSCRSLYDYATFFNTPFVSGKDSMKNDFIGKFSNGENVKISIPPTLLVTSIGHIENIDKIVTSDFKSAGDLIYLLGESSGGLLYSEFDRYFDLKKRNAPEEINFESALSRYQKINQAQKESLFQSLHDISDGGLAVSLIESTFPRSLGASIEVNGPMEESLFTERASRFVCSIKAADKDKFESLFADDITYLGKVVEDFEIKINELSINGHKAYNAWRGL